MCTIAALWCFNTVFWATNGLSICDIIYFLLNSRLTKLQTFWIPNKYKASRKYKPSVLQSVHSIYIPVGVHEYNMRLGEQKFQLLLRWTDRTAYIWRPGSDFRLQKDSDFPKWLQSHTRSGDVAILDAKISARIRYGNLAHVSDGCRQKHCIQNCGQKAADKDMVTFNSL